MEQEKLLASDGAEADQFGASVAISGDTVVVGAHGDDDSGTLSGSAYVFTRTGSSWMEQEKLVASDGAGGEQFGISVAVSGDTDLVGDHRDDDNGAFSGSAYVFTRTGSSWTEQKLLPSDGAVADLFGNAVAVSGDTAIICANRNDDDGLFSGSAYVFTQTGSSWTQRRKLLASDGEADDRFGTSVGVSGDTAVVGAYLSDDAGGNSRFAYVFTGIGVGGTQEQKLVPSHGTGKDDAFGWAVAVSGDTVVGAYKDDENGDESGAAYVFTPAP
jgi:hypothetical protein